MLPQRVDRDSLMPWERHENQGNQCFTTREAMAFKSLQNTFELSGENLVLK